MSQTKRRTFDPNSLNGEHLVLWFDDLGTGNDEYSFLSNFHEGEPITLPGVTWGALRKACGLGMAGLTLPAPYTALADSAPIEFITGEHAFAAMKFWGSDFEHFYDIVNARETEVPTKDGKTYTLSAPNHAKSLGRSREHPLRPDWEAMKLDVMAAITRAKYAPNRAEAKRLLDTGDRLLVEGTFWGDEVWGVDLNNEKLFPGRNWLGSILMMRRAELRALAACVYNSDTGSNLVTKFVQNTGTYNTEFAIG